jgi:diaminopimelate epimerase
MRFVKMHALGNDYVYIDAYTDPALQSHFEDTHGQRLIRDMSRRHTGIGSDGVILVCRASDPALAHVRMRMFNADGSESEMCGNGIRCVAKFAHDRLAIRPDPMLVQTGRGVLSISYRADDALLTEATVDMGEPILVARDVPVALPNASPAERVVNADARSLFFADPDLAHAGIHPGMTCVSMGNPHAVFFCDDLDRVPLSRLGPRIERHPVFPRRTNAHFVQVLSDTHARMATWERGAGPTLACGTGACAVLVAAVLNGRLSRASSLDLPGGTLRISWDEPTNHVFMTGPATDSFEGEWPDY